MMADKSKLTTQALIPINIESTIFSDLIDVKTVATSSIIRNDGRIVPSAENIAPGRDASL